MNELLRHSSMPLVSGLLTDLRSHGIAFTFFCSMNLNTSLYLVLLYFLRLNNKRLVGFSGAAQVSSLFWSLNSDLHQEKVTNALEYISTMKAKLEPWCPSSDGGKNALESLFSVHQDFGKGRFHVRFKLRKGRVRVMVSSLSLSRSIFCTLNYPMSIIYLKTCCDSLHTV